LGSYVVAIIKTIVYFQLFSKTAQALIHLIQSIA